MRPRERTEREVDLVLEEERLQGVRASAERRVVHAAHLPRAARAVVGVTVQLTVAHEHHPRRERSVDARQVLLDPAELPRVGPAVHLGVYHGEVHTCLLERIPAVVIRERVQVVDLNVDCVARLDIGNFLLEDIRAMVSRTPYQGE